MDKSIAEFSRAPISEAVGLLEAIHSSLSPRERLIVTRILEEMKERMKFLEQVGVGYLSLSRPSTTLSGGEAQRIRLATQIGSALVGVIYVLDEPSIGLHQSDNDKLLESLKRLRDLGNTVVVVEHDEDTIRAADWVIDLGPGAGVEGGEVIAMGTPEQILESELSLTAKYLRNERRIEVPLQRRKVAPGRVLRIEKANLHNLKIDEVEVPLGLLTCVTGVSGSGKSSLILETLYPYLAKELYGSKVSIPEGLHILGTDHLDKVIDIDQTPIGRTPRSNPATYTGIFTLVRELFAQVPESKARGYKPGRFSFNVTGGRCEECEGDGMVKKSLHFLPDLYIQCESCLGKRYHRETLEILYRGKSIADVLDLSISESLRFFEAIPQIRSKLQLLQDVGLGYLKLGQSATTLSGGEAQRMKLSKELSKRATGRTLYILDEPSTGLHFEDIRKLLEILHRLVDQGNTVIVIEHNLDIIKTADHVIDMGPEGGSKGGRVLAAGTPEDISKSQESLTAKYLRRLLPFHDGSRGYA
jgi:excinuclease ABC subunit A